MIRLKINGEEHEIEGVDASTPLIWVLRDHLGLFGTKFGCGGGFCGACTVHLNGSPIRSCVTPVANVAGANITTIEGLAAEGELHPLQSAWIEHDVPQCGYCQAGQLMTAAAFLARNPAPDEAAINAAMSGNLCRCGTYLRIRAAILSAAAKREEDQ